MTENLAGLGEGLAGLAMEMAQLRVALAESVMKLPYIKATRNTEQGQERFVARDDVLTAIHEYAKKARAALEAAAAPAKHELNQWDDLQCKNCGLGIGRWPSEPECTRAALATPSPQAPPPSEDTSWRWLRLRGYLRQWLTPHQFEIAMDCLDKAERKQQMSNLDRERPEGLYLKFSEPLMEPHTPVIIERVNGNCTVSKFIIARDEAHELINQLCEFLRVGSPRKVGEDGRLKALEEARQICITEKNAWCKLERWLPADAADNCEIGIRALIKETEAARPSSVPVGEQKQEEGV